MKLQTFYVLFYIFFFFFYIFSHFVFIFLNLFIFILLFFNQLSSSFTEFFFIFLCKLSLLYLPNFLSLFFLSNSLLFFLSFSLYHLHYLCISLYILWFSHLLTRKFVSLFQGQITCSLANRGSSHEIQMFNKRKWSSVNYFTCIIYTIICLFSLVILMFKLSKWLSA